MIGGCFLVSEEDLFRWINIDFSVDEVSSHGARYQLTEDIINDLKKDTKFISDLRRGVQLMVRSWGWECLQSIFQISDFCL